MLGKSSTIRYFLKEAKKGKRIKVHSIFAIFFLFFKTLSVSKTLIEVYEIFSWARPPVM